MAAWLVTEDPQQFIRVDAIVNVNPLPIFKDDDELQWNHEPWRRFRAADHVQIIVGTQAGQQVRVLSCPGYAADGAIAELLYVLADLAGKYEAASQPMFVYGPRGSDARWDRGVWTVSEQIPRPDWPPRW
ncbi:hypothetical protein ACQP2T_13555 [Nonomuraea sp. CA-143628]|uniref:hypothetical protein n=1 Tax=Nonomuraea sp. CA-143628 TaxID=3239997 RepID=UPI003D8F7072